jgi:hypothetical protein
VSALGGDQVLGIYPFPSAKGPPFGERQRKPVPIAEMYRFHVNADAPADTNK